MAELVVGPATRGGRLSKTFPYNRKEEAHGFMRLERRLNCNHVSSESCCLHRASFSPPLLTLTCLPYQHFRASQHRNSCFTICISSYCGVSAPSQILNCRSLKWFCIWVLITRCIPVADFVRERSEDAEECWRQEKGVIIILLAFVTRRLSSEFEITQIRVRN